MTNQCSFHEDIRKTLKTWEEEIEELLNLDEMNFNDQRTRARGRKLVVFMKCYRCHYVLGIDIHEGGQLLLCIVHVHFISAGHVVVETLSVVDKYFANVHGRVCVAIRYRNRTETRDCSRRLTPRND